MVHDIYGIGEVNKTIQDAVYLTCSGSLMPEHYVDIPKPFTLEQIEKALGPYMDRIKGNK